ncbi:MAG: hypothetical protein R3B72_17230 [Polyangiaceae bacterium]
MTNWIRRSGLAAIACVLLGCGPGVLVQKRAAHDFSCPKDQVKVKLISGAGNAGTYEAQGCGRTALYSAMCGQNVGCLVQAEVNAADLSRPAPAPAAPEPARRKEAPRADTTPPDGAAGFTFAMTAAEAEEACTGAGKEWQADGDSPQCSGTVASVGFDSPVALKLCGDSVCRIVVQQTLDNDFEAVVGRYKEVKDLLSAKYGEPSAHKGDVPGRCDDVARCIEEGNLELRTDWTVGGYRVRIKLGQGPTLQIDYRAPKGGGKGLAL